MEQINNSKSPKTFNKEFHHIHNITHHNSSGVTRYGFMFDTIPEEIMNELSKIVTDIEESNFNKKKYNNYLAGEIEKEFEVDFNSKINKYLEDIFTYYEVRSGFVKNTLFNFQDNVFRKFLEDADNELRPGFVNNSLNYSSHFLPELIVDTPWINFQKKGEYNPMHCHSGLLSYVIWFKIPFYNQDEIQYLKNRSDKRTVNGNFSFISPFSNGYGPGRVSSFSFAVDKTYEGTIAVFPSDLNHSVNPFFTSDEYRITLSGNAFLKDNGSARDSFIEHIKKYNKLKL